MTVESPIGRRQNAQPNLRLLAAARQRHADRKRVHRWRVAGTVTIALASPLVVVFRPGWGAALGAVAGLWVFGARTVLAGIEERSVNAARRMQEDFDCAVLGVPRNPALGRPAAPEAVAAAADRHGDLSGLRDWYPAAQLGESPSGIVICQRSSVAWGQRLHYEYAWLLGVGAAAVAAAGLVTFAVRGMTLADYLVTIFLPSLPALLDATELVRAHLRASRAKGAIEEDMLDALIGGGVHLHTGRAFQDRIFAQRGADPPVSDRYYRLRRVAYERHMAEAAARLAAGDGGS